MFPWPTPAPGNDATMVLSVPVAFQYPEAAALFGLAPFGYLRSLGLKKYHSFSPNAALADKETTTNQQNNSEAPHHTQYRINDMHHSI